MVIKSKDTRQTEKIGEAIGRKLKGGEVICLYGELGSGKTTFVKGLAKGLEIKKRILSPTFVIVRHYLVKNKSFNILYHIDLYRINDPHEVWDLGLSELFNNTKNVIVLEWPERLGEFLPEKRREIYFKYQNENEREINIHD